ncbi:2Fe-2S iron-sulfur cluster-binding protein [Streptomyces sp. NPDC006668]|uniref:(2Fe-2S)-binding protein n=1 Tax=Streptomyces sp. NPDC006668 TaxID=3156903 RepID=UPI0033CFA581
MAPPAPYSSSDIILTVNGEKYALSVDHRTKLLDALRERLDLTGTKKGCNQGKCGTCTVLIEGRRAVSCLQLAVAAEGRTVTAVEGLAGGGKVLLDRRKRAHPRHRGADGAGADRGRGECPHRRGVERAHADADQRPSWHRQLALWPPMVNGGTNDPSAQVGTV